MKNQAWRVFKMEQWQLDGLLREMERLFNEVLIAMDRQTVLLGEINENIKKQNINIKEIENVSTR